MKKKILYWREAWIAVLFCIILIALMVTTSSDMQTWIYQGF